MNGYIGWSFVGVGQVVHLDCDEVVPDGRAAIDMEELLAAIDEHECVVEVETHR